MDKTLYPWIKHYILEYEFHFIMECPLYNDLRHAYIKKQTEIKTEHSFKMLMSSYDDKIISNLACYVYNAFKIHKMFNGL